jgi:hypothetical protein
MPESKSTMMRLVKVGLALFLLVCAISVLMPSLKSARTLQLKRALMTETYDRSAMRPEPVTAGEPPPAPREMTPAAVTSFDANIEVRPGFSKGTATPESIYGLRFEARLVAHSPGDGNERCAIRLPLPPDIISVYALRATANGEPSDDLALAGGALVWAGRLDARKPTELRVTYAADGKGIYRLDPPRGHIVEHFRARLVAHHTDLRMRHLALQPKQVHRGGGRTTYTWEYDRLLFGRPIVLDVLGIAAIDRLGQLVWLGPVGVVIFGLLVALVALAYRPEQLNVWTTLLMVGCFAGAYPLMYFLQEYAPLAVAVGASAGAVLIIIAVRGLSLLGTGAGLLGGVFLPAAIMALTLAAAIYDQPAMQGVLLTVTGILTLVVAMVMLPRAQRRLTAAEAETAPATPPAGPEGKAPDAQQ